ncbi:MAG: 30S ribosomal protein S9, partial [candidate division Zixibacteria bacterium]|nr:30S ribosomal protein S9 [candidate division Zixibacteria bacterium]
EAADMAGRLDITALACGGGVSGQAGAMRLAIARALIKFNPELRSAMKKGGYLTVDERKVERKKYGRPKARKRFQFSKR